MSETFHHHICVLRRGFVFVFGEQSGAERGAVGDELTGCLHTWRSHHEVETSATPSALSQSLNQHITSSPRHQHIAKQIKISIMNKGAKKSQVEVEVEVEVAQDSVIAHPRATATCRFLPAPSRAFASEIFLASASGSRGQDGGSQEQAEQGKAVSA